MPDAVQCFIDAPKMIRSYWKWKRPANDSRNVWEVHVTGYIEGGCAFQLWGRASRYVWSINLRTEDGYSYRLESDRRSVDRVSGKWIDGPHCNIEAPGQPKRTIARPDLEGLGIDEGLGAFLDTLNIELKWPYRSPHTQQELPLGGGDDDGNNDHRG